MFSIPGPITILKICVIMIVPIMIGIIWLLPKFLHSQRFTKMIVGAIIVSAYMATTVGLLGIGNLQIQSIRLITALTAFIWGVTGFLIGAYFDVRLRIELGSTYYQKFPRLRMYAVEYGVISATISLLPGIVTGWLIVTFGASIVGLFLSIIMGTLFGGIFGRVLD
jgi:hypothetical protein